MNLSENFETAKNIAVEAAQAAARKAKQLAAIAKANVAIYAEEDKVRKAERELGKLYYRDYAVGEEQDSAEYLPWCQKIDESKQAIAALQDQIAQLRAQEEACGDAAEDSCGCGKPAEAEKPSCGCGKPAEAEKPSCGCDKPAEAEKPSDDSVQIRIETSDAPEA